MPPRKVHKGPKRKKNVDNLVSLKPNDNLVSLKPNVVEKSKFQKIKGFLKKNKVPL